MIIIDCGFRPFFWPATVETGPRSLQRSPHAIELTARGTIPICVEICMHLTRVDVKRFSIITTSAIPPEQLGNNSSEVVKGDGKSEKKRERRGKINLRHRTVWRRLSGQYFV